MKVRMIKNPEYQSLRFVQVKRWWLPIWFTVFYGNKYEADEVYANLILHGHKYTVFEQGEIT